MSGTKNKLSDLNNHLFAQIERLSQEDLSPEQVDTEFKRASAITGLAEQVLRQATLQVQPAKIMSDHGNDPTPYLSRIEAKAVQPSGMKALNGTKMLNGIKAQ
jgi:Asp-tRNA(Asn)/Glu-tRNA(Gln) amidotransferase C subunit